MPLLAAAGAASAREHGLAAPGWQALLARRGRGDLRRAIPAAALLSFVAAARLREILRHGAAAHVGIAKADAKRRPAPAGRGSRAWCCGERATSLRRTSTVQSLRLSSSPSARVSISCSSSGNRRSLRCSWRDCSRNLRRAPPRRAAFRLATPENFLFASRRAGREFAVLLSVAQSRSGAHEAVTGPMVASIAVSMALTPLLLLIHQRLDSVGACAARRARS